MLKKLLIVPVFMLTVNCTVAQDVKSDSKKAGSAKQFSFERYSDDRWIKDFYPAGSKISDLVKALEEGGANCFVYTNNINELSANSGVSQPVNIKLKEGQKITTKKDYIECIKKDPEKGSLKRNGVIIYPDPEDLTKIKRIL